MRLFIKVNLLEIGVEWIREAGGDKLGLGVVGEAFLVELPLQILQRQGIVEDCKKTLSAGTPSSMIRTGRKIDILMPSLTTGVVTRFSIGEA